jgi:hypothetical protein
MAKKIEAAGYIIQDKQGNAIFGFGDTVVEAWAMAVDGAGPFFDAYGNEKSDEAAFTEDFKTYGATAALIDQVRSEGGAIAWGLVNGVACTVAEENGDDMTARNFYAIDHAIDRFGIEGMPCDIQSFKSAALRDTFVTEGNRRFALTAADADKRCRRLFERSARAAVAAGFI